ncbi:MAG: family 43 glycosylhydrolase [Clostridiales bacterium]|nr:family 43 glycosylhydrolase [Clostridiales bacterium]
MPNPYLPLNEYIPDGEPRVFGDRVYIYGSHDSASSDKFCDHKLKVWSAGVDDLNNWVCHGDSFHTLDDEDHKSDTDWTSAENDLYAPDVVEKNGKYYLYAYIMGAKGCVAVADRPEGPFKLLSQYVYDIPNHYDNGIFIDPGVLVDDDGRVYLYCGYQGSYMVELKDNMYECINDTYMTDIIPVEQPFNFFEACSLRKVGDTYYMIYSPCRNVLPNEGGGSRLCYATSDSPRGPFTYRGTIIDNGVDYPGGNNHGSICKIKDQWYIFYHKMTNGTIMSRRACVEKIEILPDGTIPQVEMTSLGFEKALNPYKATPAEIACVMTGGAIVTEKDVFTRVVTCINDGSVLGYKYFEFGEDNSSETMEFAVKITGLGMKGIVEIRIDDRNSEPIGICKTGTADGVYRTRVKCVTGYHAVYLTIKRDFGGWFVDMVKNRTVFDMESFIFIK